MARWNILRLLVIALMALMLGFRVPAATSALAAGGGVLHGLAIDPEEGTAFSGAVFSFTDSNDGLICQSGTVYDASIGWGDATTTNGVVTLTGTDGIGDCFYQLEGTHIWTEEGNYGLTGTVNESTDGDVFNGTSGALVTDAPLSGQQTNVVAVRNLPSPQVGADPGTYLGTFHDSNTYQHDCNTDSYSSTIDWGDATITPGTVQPSTHVAGDCNFDVFGAPHVYTTTAPNTITVTASESSGGISTTTWSDPLKVLDGTLGGGQGFKFPAVEGQPIVDGILGIFQDSSGTCTPATYSVTIDWGDGPDPINGNPDTTTGAVIDLGGGFCAVTGSHTYREEAASYQISVTVTNGGNTGTNVNFNAFAIPVTDAPLAAGDTPGTIAGTEGQPLTNVYLGEFTDAAGVSDPTICDPSDYSATIDWGDGTTSAGTIVFPGTHGGTPCPADVEGTHTYNDEGSYTVKITVKDKGGSQVNLSDVTANIAEANLDLLSVNAVTATEGAAMLGLELGRFHDENLTGCNASDYTVTGTWADGSPIAPGEVTIHYLGANCDFEVDGYHLFGEENPAGVNQVIIHDDAVSVEIDPAITVVDAALSKVSNATLTGLVEGAPSGPLNLGPLTMRPARGTATSRITLQRSIGATVPPAPAR